MNTNLVYFLSCEAVSEVHTGRLDMNGTVWETGEVGLSRGDTTREVYSLSAQCILNETHSDGIHLKLTEL